MVKGRLLVYPVWQMRTISPEDRKIIRRPPPEMAVARPRANQPPWASRWGAPGQRPRTGADPQTIQDQTYLVSYDDPITGQENVYYRKETARLYPERVGTCPGPGSQPTRSPLRWEDVPRGVHPREPPRRERHRGLRLALLETEAALAGFDEAIEDISIGARHIQSSQETLT